MLMFRKTLLRACLLSCLIGKILRCRDVKEIQYLILPFIFTRRFCERKSFEEYHIIPNKFQTGRPTQYTVKRNLSNPKIFLYPVPDATGLIQVELIRQVQDTTKSFQQNADAPVRFLPCLTAGLAYYMGLKRPGIPNDRIALLKANYEELLKRAMEEDKERASIFFKPKLRII